MAPCGLQDSLQTSSMATALPHHRGSKKDFQFLNSLLLGAGNVLLCSETTGCTSHAYSRRSPGVLTSRKPSLPTGASEELTWFPAQTPAEALQHPPSQMTLKPLQHARPRASSPDTSSEKDRLDSRPSQHSRTSL